MTTILCDKCNIEIGACAFKRHYNYCIGTGKRIYKKFERVGEQAKCPICDKLFPIKGVQTHYRMVHKEPVYKYCEKCSQNI
jgi:hypothetical protein